MQRGIDLGVIGARFTRLLRENGLQYAPERSGNFIRALGLLEPATLGELYWCARTTLVSSRNEIEPFNVTFQYVFGNGLSTPLNTIPNNLSNTKLRRPETAQERMGDASGANGGGESSVTTSSAGADELNTSNVSSSPTLASDIEELRTKSFAELTESELSSLAILMESMVKVFPSRRSNRTELTMSRGEVVDLRSSLRRSRASGGEVALLVRRKYKTKTRRIVALLDISGSMESYTRPYLYFLHFLSRTTKVETFSFATRLTRLTKEISIFDVDQSAKSIGSAARDWSSGTKIGSALEMFLNSYGRRGMARGAVMLIFSDGWEHGDVALLGEQMARLSRIARKIIWINPKKANTGYQPLVAGMSVALPFCDAFVSGANFDSLEELIALMAD